MAQLLTERRVHSRFGHPAITGLRAVLRPGHVIEIVNLSAGGALIDGGRPLRPGSRVFLQITVKGHTAGRTATVVRSSVVSLHAAVGAAYRSGLKFDERWDAIWEQCTLDGYLLSDGTGQQAADQGEVLPESQVVEWRRTNEGPN